MNRDPAREHQPLTWDQPYEANPSMFANNVTSIDTGTLGRFHYSPVFNTNLSQAFIVMTGKRTDDYAAAEAKPGVTAHINGVTVWHHLYDYNQAADGCTMQLVGWALHLSTYSHKGACRRWTDFHGGRAYHSVREEAVVTFADNILIPPPNTSVSAETFAERNGFTLHDELLRLYEQSPAVRAEQCTISGSEAFEIDYVAPLENAGKSSAASVQAFLDCAKTLHLSFNPTEFQFFAGDACGNLFCADREGVVWFYDHETDELSCMHVKLNDLFLF